MPSRQISETFSPVDSNRAIGDDTSQAAFRPLARAADAER